MLQTNDRSFRPSVKRRALKETGMKVEVVGDAGFEPATPAV
jgi:hypothetical protein